jgi:hypothetical protein
VHHRQAFQTTAPRCPHQAPGAKGELVLQPARPGTGPQPHRLVHQVPDSVITSRAGQHRPGRHHPAGAHAVVAHQTGQATEPEEVEMAVQ